MARNTSAKAAEIDEMEKAANEMEAWPGVAEVSRRGVAIAVEMLTDLESNEDEQGAAAYDLACLEDWPREGRPFRNVVAEYLKRARDAGPEVEAGFLAVLSDTVSMVCGGSVPSSERYDRLYPPTN
jgi:hypothetical protein